MDKDCVKRLAGFLEPLSDPTLQFMEEFRPASPEQATLIIPATYAPVVYEFMDVCTHDGWLMKGLDWSAWMRTQEARDLLASDHAMGVATLEQISKFLTALLRQERFSEGTLNEAHKTGLLVRILERVATLAS